MKYTEALDNILDGVAVAAYQEDAKMVMIPTETGIVIYNYEDWTVRDFFIPMDSWTILI